MRRDPHADYNRQWDLELTRRSFHGSLGERLCYVPWCSPKYGHEAKITVRSVLLLKIWRGGRRNRPRLDRSEDECCVEGHFATMMLAFSFPRPRCVRVWFANRNDHHLHHQLPVVGYCGIRSFRAGERASNGSGDGRSVITAGPVVRP